MRKVVIYTMLVFALFSGVSKAGSLPFLADDDKISIYPNPVTDQQFVFHTDFDVVKIDIVNIVGNTIFTTVYDVPTTEAEIQLDKLDGGIYILRFETSSKKVFVKKFLVK